MLSVDKINELQQQADQWKKEYEILDNIIDVKDKLIAGLKAENERLKEKIIKLSEENGNLIIRANTCENNYRDTQRRLDELCKANIHNLALLSKANKTLQEIKAIAIECTTCGDCFNCKYTEHCSTDIEAQALGVCRMILKLIPKVEEE